VDITALLNGPESVRDRGEQTDAERVIEDLLEDDSAWPLEARSALDAGRARGINDRTLQRAAHRAGIRIERVGFGRGGRWLWHRPSGIGDSIADTPPETATVSSMSPMDPQPTNTARRDPDAPIGDTPTVTGTAAEREDDDDARY
jgi:hypothetical protein